VLKTAASALICPKALYIFVDSQAAIQRLAGFSDLAHEAKTHCRTLVLRGITVFIQWCPSHQGIYGNEIADTLAKKGLKLAPISTPIVSYSYLARKAKQATIEEWKHLWTEADSLNPQGYGKHYCLILRGKLPKLSLQFRPFSGVRAIQAAYIQLRTAFGPLKSHLRTVGKTADSLCWCCSLQLPQTPRHLLVRCPAYETERRTLRQALDGMPLTMRLLFCTKKGLQALETFISSTKICTEQWLQTAYTAKDASL
jgi:hypothetical protein